jgi:putative FmdB family regulatory protein
MPIYEYSCPTCGVFEVSQRITESPLKKCPTCKSKVRKLISATSFQLKGSGWYATDYGGKKDAPKESAKDGETASDSTPAKSDAADKPSDGAAKTKDTKPAKKDSAAKAA